MLLRELSTLCCQKGTQAKMYNYCYCVSTANREKGLWVNCTPVSLPILPLTANTVLWSPPPAKYT
jgi:hypothetical protein